ncbi:MAG: UDP-N-acetylmuramate:L-alanyl-gamma-D-glutamyl-meso-diaminopimelate ligase [Verrucomicrobiales bacterium]|nr:UDP-N-acetylmuramate:L-alanyl-gamma-D-glutamyl-meso-diaminopimelate ligase [Verrucomicrobiales bacterium]
MISTNGKPNHLYFMGICGTAMGSVAAAFRDAGYRVTGSDANVYDPMKSFLEGKGIEILDGYKAENLPDEADLFVIGNAQSRGNPEVEAVLSEKRHFVSMPELVKECVLRGKRNLIVSGTHGKTTTSSLLAWILESAGENPSFMIGGIPGNLEQGARFTESDFVVLEGDEYDTAFFDKRSKFIHYLPEIAIVNNIEFDHADIYNDIDEIKTAFGNMVRIIPENGVVLMNGDDANCRDVYAAQGHSPVKWIGFGEDCHTRISSVDYRADETEFEIEEETYVMPLNGEFNVRNGAMAVTAARAAGVSPDAIREALLAFVGVKRRQEIRGVTDRGITVVDDFGHHPTAIREALTGMRKKFEGSRLWAIFEPRSNTTRRNIFQEELPDALGHADAVCIAAVANPEKVAIDQRLDTDRVMAELREDGKPAFYEPNADAIVERVKAESKDGDVVIVFSNGGFDGIHDKLLEAL